MLRVRASRSLGWLWLVDGLWRQLGVETALCRVFGPRHLTTDVARVLFASVAKQALNFLQQARHHGAGSRRVSLDSPTPPIP